MTGKTTSVAFEIVDLDVHEKLKTIVAAMDGFRVKNSGHPLPADILIMEIGEDPERDFQRIQELRKNGSAGAVCLTFSKTEPELLIRAMRVGAKEIIQQPIREEEVRSALELLRESSHHEGSPEASPRVRQGKIINVIGGKGGVGTTTVAVNIAASLKEQESVGSVALIDMNLLLGEVPLFLDIKPTFNWGEVAQNISRLDTTYLMSILSKHNSGVYVLPSPTGLNGGQVATPEIIDRILGLMRTEFDYIVIDSGLSMDQLSLRVLQLSDSVMIVSILSLPCLINVRKLLDTFKQLGYPGMDKVHLVMNRYHKKSVISVKEAQEGVQKKISWFVPNDYQTTMAAINQGKTLCDIAPADEITGKFMEIAASFQETESDEPKKRHLFSWGARKKQA